MRRTIVTDQHQSVSLSFDDNSLIPLLFGEHNAHLRHIEKLLNVDIASRGNTISIKGEKEPLDEAKTLFSQLWNKLEQNHAITTQDIDAAIRFLKNQDQNHKNGHKTSMTDTQAIKTGKNKQILPRSPNQAAYIDAIRSHDMVFGIGPAGTGKTYLAVAMAVSMYNEGLIERMIFCRPAVEAGENLGFLPGDMLEKIDPYLRPIFDALYDMMPADTLTKKMDKGDIEIAPLAFMRGRTLKNAFVVLDEAQNTTAMQMKMFLTRMGEGTRMVITGDPSQTDLPKGTDSGLKQAMHILKDEQDIAFTEFSAGDVVRHKLVSKIINAYDRHDAGSN